MEPLRSLGKARRFSKPAFLDLRCTFQIRIFQIVCIFTPLIPLMSSTKKTLTRIEQNAMILPKKQKSRRLNPPSRVRFYQYPVYKWLNEIWYFCRIF